MGLMGAADRLRRFPDLLLQHFRHPAVRRQRELRLRRTADQVRYSKRDFVKADCLEVRYLQPHPAQ
jgi:hypothetical protein